MERIQFLVHFDGDLAVEHKLPAYEAAQSISGIARSLIIPTNYLFEGRVRRRKFDNIPFELNMVAQRPGSFETLIELLFEPSTLSFAAGGIGIGVTANLISDFSTSLFKRVTGQSASQEIQDLERDERLPSGDLSAIADAMEPSVRQSHLTIGNGATVINVSGNNNTINMTPATKVYVNNTAANPEVRVRLFSVASLNSNTGYGRVFDSEEGRTVPFQLPKDIDGASVAVLLDSFNRYARRRWMGNDEASLVAVRYTTLEGPDGKVKKIIPIDARAEISDF